MATNQIVLDLGDDKTISNIHDLFSSILRERFENDRTEYNPDAGAQFVLEWDEPEKIYRCINDHDFLELRARTLIEVDMVSQRLLREQGLR